MDQDIFPELPSDELIYRVTGTRSREWFRSTGSRSVNEINAVLSVIGTSIKDYPQVLDWGCGCGRILLHLQEVGQKVELYGVDIDPEAIAWAQQHISWAQCSVCNALPPLDFPDSFFDLIYNHSVMTHLDEQYQDAWLAELQRVVKPEGIVLLTVSGDYPFDGLEKTWREAGANPAPLRETLRKKGILYIADDHWKGGPFPDFYHSTFHAPWYIFEHWGQFFEIKAYIVRGSVDFQDFVLMRRRSKENHIEYKDSKDKATNIFSNVVQQDIVLSQFDDERRLPAILISKGFFDDLPEETIQSFQDVSVICDFLRYLNKRHPALKTELSRLTKAATIAEDKSEKLRATVAEVVTAFKAARQDGK